MRTRTRGLAAALLGIALLLGSASPAWAAPDSPDETGATRFLRWLDEHGRDTVALRAVLAGDDDEAKRDVIHRGLMETDEAYRAAVGRFEEGLANAEDFAQLLGDPTKLATSENPWRAAHAAYFLGRTLVRRDEPSLAASVLDALDKQLRAFHQWPAQARLHRALAQASGVTPDVEAAKATLRELLDRAGPETPERYREAAVFVLRELSGEGSGPLVEIARKMEWIERRLDGGEAGKKVRQRQDEVLTTLDELIAALKEQQKQGQGQGQQQPGGT